MNNHWTIRIKYHCNNRDLRYHSKRWIWGCALQILKYILKVDSGETKKLIKCWLLLLGIWNNDFYFLFLSFITWPCVAGISLMCAACTRPSNSMKWWSISLRELIWCSSTCPDHPRTEAGDENCILTLTDSSLNLSGWVIIVNKN